MSVWHKTARARSLLLWLIFVPALGFAFGHTPRHSIPTTFSKYARGASKDALLESLRIRGGTIMTSESSLNAKLADYSGAARSLFGNMQSPAALLAGGLVPLGLLGGQLPPNKDRPFNKKLQRIYNVIAVLSLSNELLAVTYATVASNKLTESVLAPSSSVFALIKRDFELQWVAVNTHFICGLVGFLALVMIRALALFSPKLNVAAACTAASSLMGMLSVVNRGVAAGDGAGQVHGSNLLTLMMRYVRLLVAQTKSDFGILSIASIAGAAISSILVIRAILAPDDDEEE